MRQFDFKGLHHQHSLSKWKFQISPCKSIKKLPKETQFPKIAEQIIQIDYNTNEGGWKECLKSWTEETK